MDTRGTARRRAGCTRPVIVEVWLHLCTSLITDPACLTAQRVASSRGKLVVAMHAMTEDGLLYQEGGQGVPMDTSIHEEQLSCEWIFPQKSGYQDYHDNMDGEMFFLWLEKRFVPTWKAVYGDLDCVIVMDNAPYHRLKGPHHIDLKKLGRADLVKLMRTQDEADAQRAQDLAAVINQREEAMAEAGEKAAQEAREKAASVVFHKLPGGLAHASEPTTAASVPLPTAASTTAAPLAATTSVPLPTAAVQEICPRVYEGPGAL